MTIAPHQGDFYKTFSMPDDRYINQMSELDVATHIQRNKAVMPGYKMGFIRKFEPPVDSTLEQLEAFRPAVAGRNGTC